MHEAHNLMPETLRAQIPALYTAEKTPDPMVWAKYFTPDSSWTWYAIEFDPKERLFFGWVVGLEHELGYFSLLELEESTGPLGLRIERDLGFTAQPLSQVQAMHQEREEEPCS